MHDKFHTLASAFIPSRNPEKAIFSRYAEEDYGTLQVPTNPTKNISLHHDASYRQYGNSIPEAYQFRELGNNLRLEDAVMPDKIAIDAIRCHGRHGANPGEKDHSQAFDVQIEIMTDLSKSEITDSLEDTINYVKIYDIIIDTVASTSFNLLERLGGEILRRIFVSDVRINEIRIAISKPALLSGATASVALLRNRSSITKADHTGNTSPLKKEIIP